MALGKAMDQFAPDLSSEEAGRLELALAEILNNIVEHAYAGRAPGPVHLRLDHEARALTCLIEDEGPPMPGLALPEGRMPDTAVPTETLAEGGWGWALIRALTVDLRYERHGRLNRVSFRVPIGPPQARGTR